MSFLFIVFFFTIHCFIFRACPKLYLTKEHAIEQIFCQKFLLILFNYGKDKIINLNSQRETKGVKQIINAKENNKLCYVLELFALKLNDLGICHANITIDSDEATIAWLQSIYPIEPTVPAGSVRGQNANA